MAKHIIAVSEAQKEIFEKLCFELNNAPIQPGGKKVITFDCTPYTDTQLKGLMKQVFTIQ
jgi:hypothetical protein